MTTSSSRERQAQRRAAERARIKARQAAIEREAAERAEQIAEDQAPLAQRINGTAAPDAKRGGYRRASLLGTMAAHGVVTGAHLRAAARFSTAYEVGIIGASPVQMAVEWVDGASGDGITDRQLAEAAVYVAACDALGASLRSPVQWAALHRWSLAEIAYGLGVSEARASGYLVAGLDRLADHFWPGRPPRETRPQPVQVDPAVVDVAQNRLGRWRASVKIPA